MTGRTRSQLIILWTILLVGIAVRLAFVARPFDHRIVNAWRQADYYQLTRNFYREGQSIFYPRIDWRGDTPGFAEMELPILPWFGARLYQIFGPHDQILRAMSATIAIANLFLFTLLARKILPPLGSAVAVAVFALNPILIILSTAMQPEPLMHLFILASALCLWSWWKHGAPVALVAVGLFLGLAILSKLTAAFFGLVVAYSVLRKLGIRSAFSFEVYLAGLLTVLPPALWYTWAHRFWTDFGISLGLSNESHWIGLDLLLKPMFAMGILKWETVLVLTPVGWLLLLFAARLPWPRIEFPAMWFTAAVVFYFFTARTSADYWAWYYHLLSVAPAAILVGAGVDSLARGTSNEAAMKRVPSSRAFIVGIFILLLITSEIAVSGALIYRRDFTHENLRIMRACSQEFANLVKPTEFIAVHGGRMYDATGRPIAHNESMVFAWMDRKGFCYGEEELSAGTLTAFAERGADFWMVNRDEIADRESGDHPDEVFRQVAECEDAYILYDLSETVPPLTGTLP